MEHGHDHVIHLKRPQETPVAAHTEAPVQRPAPTRKRRWRGMVITGIAFVLGIAVGLVLKPVPQNTASIETYAPPAGTKPAPHTQTDIVKAVANLIQVPDETPSLATVSDLAPLRDQEFFASSQVGDVLLLFPQSRRAMLYRPSENKLIQVAPLTLSQ